MYYSKVECPHCGNEFTVNNERKSMKCCWCKRRMSIKFERLGKKKVRFTVEPMESLAVQKNDYSKWEEQDIYGQKQY